MTATNQNRPSSSGNFPLDNLTYDLITILHEKAKGLEAYDKYQRDAQGNQEIGELIRQIRRQDEQHIQQLRRHLAQRLSSQDGTSSRAVGEPAGGSASHEHASSEGHGSSMGGSPSVSLSTLGTKVSEKVDTEDKTNPL
jgi:hypothetical protein